MEPELFRMNTNQFLQTARTVTFIIQKHKSAIPNFANWYNSNVIDSWGNDPIMSWAKDSRNTIEKEGDLELHSQLHVTLIFSYLSENDISITTGAAEVVGAGVKKLIRFSRKRLPTGVGSDAVIKIERRWVTASLAAWELVHALTYVYSRIFEVCEKIAHVLGEDFNSNLPDTSDFERFRDDAQRVTYVKLATLESHSITIETRTVTRSEVPENVKSMVEGFGLGGSVPRSMEGILEYHEKMAEATFSNFGNHVPMLFIYDDSWKPVDMISTNFEDRADKYIFWRRMADRVATQNAFAIAWVAESWIRSMEGYPIVPIKDLRITGEHLCVIILDRHGNYRQVSWSISRSQDGGVNLTRNGSGGPAIEFPNYLVPIRRVWNLPDGKTA